jgi:hypothetical protein
MVPALAALLANMKNPELLIEVTPSGDPLLRGSCSACHNVTFAFVGDTAENRRLMKLAFEKHCREVHMQDDPIIPRA